MLAYDEISLNGTWELRDEDLSAGPNRARQISGEKEGWLPQPVPGDIHQGLVSAGRIQEPLVGMNSLACRWTENRSWWWRKTFFCPPKWREAEVVELELNGLDSQAEIFLNGDALGSHHSAFYPWSRDIKPWLRYGKNVLLIKLTAGLETISDVDVDAAQGILVDSSLLPERGDARRVYVRKPAYTFGWDWSPRLATTAIGGDVRLRAMSGACIRHVSLRSEWNEADEVRLHATVEVDYFHYYQTGYGRVKLTLFDAAGHRFGASQEGLLRSGLNYIDLTISINKPRLWWPNGMGEQHLYRVEAVLESENGRVVFPVFEYGIRFIELETQERFAFWINGERIFCKGGNWIPADALYARVSAERYDWLVREAQKANFNMLRVWGGGLYEPDAFYHACDRYGILLWHDFMFACAPYPDHLPSFRMAVEREADYQTRRLQKHACLALWCGNNENHWGFRDWWHEKTRGGAYLYNYLLPRVVRANCPEIPYWNSSPYGGEAPNSQKVGDHHLWNQIMMNPVMEKRIDPEEYDRNPARFVSEFGYVGACDPQTMAEALDGAPFDIQSKAWRHHTNTFEKNTVLAGIRKHYLDPETLSMPDYFLFSGMCQGMMLGYALEAMRANPECYGGLFWMYADCWGEIGWTVIDYGLRRKPSWYYVRRALSPLRLILRKSGQDGIRVLAANDRRTAYHGELEYGYITLDGSACDLQRCTVDIPALSRAECTSFPRGDYDSEKGLWVARFPGDTEQAPAIFRAVDVRKLKLPRAALLLEWEPDSERSFRARVFSPVYAHAVRLILPEGGLPADNYFDLLPGEERVIGIQAGGDVKREQVRVTCYNAA